MTLSLISDTRSELLALARLVAEDPSCRRRAFEVVPMLADVYDALRLFDLLVEAVAEQDEFENGPADYLNRRDMGMRSVYAIADSLADATSGLVDLLTAGLEAS